MICRPEREQYNIEGIPVLSEKLTIAMICPTYTEGAHIFSDDLVDGLDPDRFRAITIFLKQKGERQKSTVDNGRKIYCLSGKKKLHSVSLPILFRLVRILKDEKVDIIHAHRHKPCFYGVLAGMIAKTPVTLFHVHGLARTKNLGRKILNAFTFKHVNKVIGCANSVRDDTIKANPSVDPKKIIALRNSVDFERFAMPDITKADARNKSLPSVPKDAFVYGTIARFGPYKGHNHLIEAFKQVRSEVASAHLILTGTGQRKEDIRQQVKKEGLEQYVHFLGFRKDIPDLLRAMDVFVLPSIGSEGMPLVLLEAMASGVPCIATRLSGIPEVINTDEVGCLVPVRDENELAKAMTGFSRKPQSERNSIIEKARERICKYFKRDIVVKELEGIYESVYSDACSAK